MLAGDVHLTADFGYNYVSYDDATDPAPGALGAIGDRLWNDANGDGVQDPGEAGLSDVTVSLLTDDNGDGIYGGAGDNAATVTTTDASGNYIFDDLPAGAYVVEVDATTLPTLPAGDSWVQTGDPDADLDGKTTAPVILAPGDAYLNADFGYQSQDSGNQPTGSTIGDRIYLDTNGDGIDDGQANDPGIAGVSVALLDANGDVIATTVTDDTGTYVFPGLPAGDYTVRVTDTADVLGTYVQSGDPDGGNDGESAVSVDGINDNLDQDFGYTAPNQGQGNELGAIGDTVFLDSNGNDAFDCRRRHPGRHRRPVRGRRHHPGRQHRHRRQRHLPVRWPRQHRDLRRKDRHRDPTGRRRRPDQHRRS